MSSFQESWWMNFVPECYFDTVLFNKLLQTNKRLMHRKGCNNVVRDLDSERLKNSFAVALIDKDKKELDYLKQCEVLYDQNKIILLKHKSRQHFIIQLNPPLEKWVIEILDENDLQIEDFGFSRNFKILKRQIKNDIDKEDNENLNKLINTIIGTNCESIKKIRSFLLYLKDRNYQTDINELING